MAGEVHWMDETVAEFWTFDGRCYRTQEVALKMKRNFDRQTKKLEEIYNYDLSWRHGYRPVRHVVIAWQEVVE